MTSTSETGSSAPQRPLPTTSIRLLLSRLSASPAETAAVIIAIVVLAILVLAPVLFLAFGSFRSAGPGAPNAEFTLANWEAVFRPRGLEYLRNSAILGGLTALFSVPIGVFMAWLMVRTNMPGRRFLSSMILLPLLFSSLLTTIAWIGLGGPNAGILNVIARQVFGAEGAVFQIYSVAGVVMILVFNYTPYVYLAARAALAGMDRDLEDASRLLGSSTLSTLRRVTIPIMAPAILGSALLVFVLSAENFAVPALIGLQSNFLTIPYGIYESMRSYPSSPGVGAAYALLLMSVTIVGMFFYLRSIRRAAKFVTVSGKGQRSAVIKLNRTGKVFSAAFCWAFLAVGVGLPYATLLYGSFSKFFATTSFDLSALTLDHYAKLLTSPQFLGSVRTTLILILVGATIAVIFSSFLAWISVRSKSRLRHIVDYLTSLPIMIPGIALGVGMLWAYLYIPTGLYGTIGVLILAMVTRFMGHGNRIATSGLLQVNPELEEAARTLGSSRLRAFWSITMRSIGPALVSAWVLVAIFISEEVSASVMLYTGSNMPLSIFVWLTEHSGVVSEAFAAGAILSTLTFLVILIAQRRFRVLDEL